MDHDIEYENEDLEQLRSYRIELIKIRWSHYYYMIVMSFLMTCHGFFSFIISRNSDFYSSMDIFFVEFMMFIISMIAFYIQLIDGIIKNLQDKILHQESQTAGEDLLLD